MKKVFLAAVAILMVQFSFSQSETNSTSAEDRLNGIAKRKELEEKSLLKNVLFRNVGPTIMSGRAVKVEVNPNDATQFYVAYASGGLWFTNNNGQSFSSVFDKEDVITIGDVAVEKESAMDSATNDKNTHPKMSVFVLISGFLSSQAVSSQVLSAFTGLTTVFGMGTGGSP